MNENNKDAFQCTECQAGVMRLKRLTYFTWLGEELVTVPDFPAWVCDVCGRREYDAHAISRLTTLLNPDTGRSPVAQRRPRPPVKKRDTTRPLTK